MLSPDPSQALLAFAGDEVLCTDCREVLAIFPRDSYGLSPGPHLRTVGMGVARRGGLYCRRCRGGAAPRGGPGSPKRIVESRSARLLIRSGSWTGWRMLGGE